MTLKRNGSTLLNTDNEAYIAAQKRFANKRERRRKDELLEDLRKRVEVLEAQLKKVMERLEQSA